MIFKSLRFTEGFFVRLGRDHLRVVRAGLVLGAIGGCNYEGEQGRGSKGEQGTGLHIRRARGEREGESKGQAYKILRVPVVRSSRATH